jgi:DNA-binding GntR family transcriptional regulator
VRLAKTIGDQIAEALRSRIVNGEYAPGTRLVERSLAEEFGTSQGPIRDAIKVLESLNLVATRAHAGTWVKGECNLEMAETFRVKAVLQMLAGELIAQARPDLGTLREHELAARRAAEAGFAPAFLKENGMLHSAIVQASGNAPLGQLWESLGTEPLCLADRFEFALDMEREVLEHAEIFAALAAGDAPEAGRRLREHTEQFAEALQSARRREPKTA